MIVGQMQGEDHVGFAQILFGFWKLPALHQRSGQILDHFTGFQGSHPVFRLGLCQYLAKLRNCRPGLVSLVQCQGEIVPVEQIARMSGTEGCDGQLQRLAMIWNGFTRFALSCRQPANIRIDDRKAWVFFAIISFRQIKRIGQFHLCSRAFTEPGH